MRDMAEYGRYVDEKDGLPRWNVPPRNGFKALRAELLRDAIDEFYADWGAKWLSERMGGKVPLKSIYCCAYRRGVTCNERGRRMGLKMLGRHIHRKYVTDRVRLDYGLRQESRYHVRRQPEKTRCMRSVLRRRNGYHLGNPPYLFYDAATRRRDDERQLTERLGIVFVEDDECRA